MKHRAAVQHNAKPRYNRWICYPLVPFKVKIGRTLNAPDRDTTAIRDATVIVVSRRCINRCSHVPVEAIKVTRHLKSVTTVEGETRLTSCVCTYLECYEHGTMLKYGTRCIYGLYAALYGRPSFGCIFQACI